MSSADFHGVVFRGWFGWHYRVTGVGITTFRAPCPRSFLPRLTKQAARRAYFCRVQRLELREPDDCLRRACRL